ncbi:MAG TPA: heavy metal-binding protein [Gammaproteobacteria bacterium]|nr:heavy metal-binding protein [Gammaproteobacteria bacterium]
MSDTIYLKVTGMTCNHCVMRTKKALEAVDGVDNAEVTLEPGGAVVLGTVTADVLVAAVKDAGYEAELA